MNNKHRFHIPGKLFLAGEYAVTKPGQPAVLTPVDRGLQIEANLSAGSTGQIILRSDQYEAAYQTSWAAVSAIRAADLETGSWTFVRAAMAVFYQSQQQLDFDNLPTVELTISSSMKAKEGKLGLGSSAAVTVAIVLALHAAHLEDDDRLAVFKEAAFAHYLVQGSGSLGDIATAAFNQTIFYQAPAWLADQKAFEPSDFTNLDWSLLAIDALEWPSNWSFAIVASRQPASTRKALAQKIDLAPLFEPSKKAVLAVKQAIEASDYEALKKALNENQQLLIETLPEGYQTEKLATFLQLLDRLDLAGKISGAGFGDNGFVVGDQAHSLFPMKTAARVAGLTVID
ncbi:mevalonate kinase [Fructobacillus papyrifericola]|uniref:Phosphomevalonate kinase n=1 Tax=Fructobacillus papyrifericola TaxID=2713172 RepID=A0ABS5QRW0_9LACO|nr:hypothetical protein [Fructobacillus papyrifericola]MBS9335865.1 hypothetical protein [Fructobacillus papyrifericola]